MAYGIYLDTPEARLSLHAWNTRVKGVKFPERITYSIIFQYTYQNNSLLEKILTLKISHGSSKHMIVSNEIPDSTNNLVFKMQIGPVMLHNILLQYSKRSWFNTKFKYNTNNHDTNIMYSKLFDTVFQCQ